MGWLFLFHKEGGFSAADDKKSIPNAGKVDNPPTSGKAAPVNVAPRRKANPLRPRRRLPRIRAANKGKDAAKPRRGRPVKMTRQPPTRPSRNFGARTVNMAAFGGVPIPLRRSVCVCLHLTAEHQGVVSKRPEAETAVLYC